MNWPLIFCIGLLLALGALCLWAIVKPPFGKGSGWGRSQGHVQALMTGIMNRDKRNAMEYVMVEKEDAEREDDEGDDKSRFEEE